MEQLINEPPKISPILKLGIWLSEKITGKRMVPARLLAWSSRLAFGSAVFESLVIHNDPTLSNRLLKLLRMQVSFFVACPFCMDMNSSEQEKYEISRDEILALQGEVEVESVASFSKKERLALSLGRQISMTPPKLSQALRENLKEVFNEREILILTTTAAQVNYWARLIQSLGISPAGFTCDIHPYKKNTV